MVILVIGFELDSNPQQAAWDLNEMNKLSMGPLQGERLFFRASEYILFEILD